MLMATPVSIEQAFARHGVRISQVGSPPELCDRVACTGLDTWGGESRSNIYFRPQHGKDFMVVLFKAASDAHKIAAFERTHAGLGTATHASVLLVYLKSSTRIAKLRAALTGVR
jgi:hypothetical protein